MPRTPNTKAPVLLACRSRKLTVEQKHQIGARRAAGELLQDLAAEYNIHHTYAGRIAQMYDPARTQIGSFDWLAKQAAYQGGEA